MRVVLMVLLFVVLLTGISQAATLQWDRNTEADMKDYQIYACFTNGCTVSKTPAMLQPGAVVQPVVGVVPSYVLDIAGKEGTVAVSARDLTNNESGLSVSVPFDNKAPLSPANPRFQ